MASMNTIPSAVPLHLRVIYILIIRCNDWFCEMPATQEYVELPVDQAYSRCF